MGKESGGELGQCFIFGAPGSKAGSSLVIQCTLFILLVVFIGCLRSVRPEKMTQYFKALDVINIMQFNTPIAYIRQVLKGWEAKQVKQ